MAHEYKLCPDCLITEVEHWVRLGVSLEPGDSIQVVAHAYCDNEGLDDGDTD